MQVMPMTRFYRKKLCVLLAWESMHVETVMLVNLVRIRASGRWWTNCYIRTMILVFSVVTSVGRKIWLPRRQIVMNMMVGRFELNTFCYLLTVCLSSIVLGRVRVRSI